MQGVVLVALSCAALAGARVGAGAGTCSAGGCVWQCCRVRVAWDGARVPVVSHVGVGVERTRVAVLVSIVLVGACAGVCDGSGSAA